MDLNELKSSGINKKVKEEKNIKINLIKNSTIYKYFFEDNKRKKYFLIIFSILFLIGIFLTVFYLYNNKYQNKNLIFSSLENTKTIKHEDASKNEFIDGISNIVEPPTNEDVTLGVIKDNKNLVKVNDNFKKSKKGDVLIIYPSKTYIYDPLNKSIVDIISINLLNEKEVLE